MSSVSGNIVTPVEPAKIDEPGGLGFNVKPNQSVSYPVAYKSLETTRRVSVKISVINAVNITDVSVLFANGTDTMVFESGATHNATVKFVSGATDGAYSVEFDSINTVVA